MIVDPQQHTQGKLDKNIFQLVTGHADKHQRIETLPRNARNALNNQECTCMVKQLHSQ